jgi:hypothetical protein
VLKVSVPQRGQRDNRPRQRDQGAGKRLPEIANLFQGAKRFRHSTRAKQSRKRDFHKLGLGKNSFFNGASV